MTLYFSSDEHYYHKRIIKLANRPFDNLNHMHDILITNHNKVVRSSDTVIHIGDFCLGSQKKRKEILKQLNGTHLLILGNHDKGGTISSMNAGFAFASTYLELHLQGFKIAIKHYPYRPRIFKRLFNLLRYRRELKYMERRPVNKGEWLLHGHSHSCTILNKHQINIAVEAWNYTPVSEQQIIKIIKENSK